MSVSKKLIDDRRATTKTRRYQAYGKKTEDLAWVQVNSANLIELIDMASRCGGAIRLGLTSDGGALAMGVYGDGNSPYTVYANSVEGMEEHIAGIYAVFESTEMESKRSLP
jgi:hypothetical protein